MQMRFHVLGAIVALVAYCETAYPCSTCLCGDPTLTSLGVEKPYEGRLRLSLSTLRRSESVGVAGINRRELNEQRTTLGIAYWPNERLALGLRLPWVEKELEDASLMSQHTSALGDVELDGRYYLWQDRPAFASQLVGLQGGLRLPTADKLQEGGEVLDSDVQPGGGLWLLNIGAWYGYFNFPWLVHASTTYTYGLGEGYDGYEFGNAVNLSLSGQYGLNAKLALQLGMDMRWSGRDSYDGVTDEDSGGFIAYASPGLIVTLAPDLLLTGKVQLPVSDQLNGEHEEGQSYHLGVTYDF